MWVIQAGGSSQFRRSFSWLFFNLLKTKVKEEPLYSLRFTCMKVLHVYTDKIDLYTVEPHY